MAAASPCLFLNKESTISSFPGVHVREFAEPGLDQVGRGDLPEGGQGLLQVLADPQEALQPEQEVELDPDCNIERISRWKSVQKKYKTQIKIFKDVHFGFIVFREK